MNPQEQHVQKIRNILGAIRNEDWSVNEFLINFYNSNNPDIRAQANRNLTYVSGTRYGPEVILDAWTNNVPNRPSQDRLNRALTEQVTRVVVDESTRAYHHADLQLPATSARTAQFSNEFAFSSVLSLYQRLLPCLWIILHALLTAQNDYERRYGYSKQDKDFRASGIMLVIISMLLFGRNRATNIFQLIFGVFLSSAGAGRRVLDVCNHMGLTVSYTTVQRCLRSLTRSARANAIDFVKHSDRLFAIVYDNINFTLRKAGQRIDNTTQQVNATTSAVIALPSKFTRAVHGRFLSRDARKPGLRKDMKKEDLLLTEEKQQHMVASFKRHVQLVLLQYAPGLKKSSKRRKRLLKKSKEHAPHLHPLGFEKTQCFPLPSLDEEESSVAGTIRVVTKIFTVLLDMAVGVIESQLRLMVGDWLTIRNLRLMRDERSQEFNPFERMDWIQEASMPFHFQLNAMYALFRTHLGHASDNDSSSLGHHRTLLQHTGLDPKKPEYNRAVELVSHSLIARIMDCTRVLLGKEHLADLKSWKPKWEEFNDLTGRLVEQFASTSAGHDALEHGDEVLAHSIFFIRDALMFFEFNSAIKDADVGRMWMVYDHWLFMMRGAGCHNYGNEILEMKAQFQYEYAPELAEIVEHTWLVNRWGRMGKSIATDRYLEHNNGFMKTMFDARGSASSLDYIINKSSACIEVLRALTHAITSFFRIADYNRGHTEVNSSGDLQALCLDMEIQGIHSFQRRRVPPPVAQGKKARSRKEKVTTGVHDVLEEGRDALIHKGLFEKWKTRTGEGDDAGKEIGEDIVTGTAFDDPEGAMLVDASLDPDLDDESPFSNVDVIISIGEE